MQELLHAALSPVNLIYSLFLMIVFLYWIGIILGALDISAVDIDLDIDADVDMDVDLDAEVGGNVGWFMGALQFFNFGKLPFMFIMSFVAFFAWAISILAHQYLGGGTGIFALALFFPNLFISLSLTKLLTTPFIPAFAKFEKVTEPMDYIGQTCQLVLPANTSKMGQAEVLTEDNNTLLINVKVSEDKPEALYKGDQAVIISNGANKNYYIIEKI